MSTQRSQSVLIHNATEHLVTSTLRDQSTWRRANAERMERAGLESLRHDITQHRTQNIFRNKSKWTGLVEYEIYHKQKGVRMVELSLQILSSLQKVFSGI